jgi:hypothetical protein
LFLVALAVPPFSAWPTIAEDGLGTDITLLQVLVGLTAHAVSGLIPATCFTAAVACGPDCTELITFLDLLSLEVILAPKGFDLGRLDFVTWLCFVDEVRESLSWWTAFVFCC